MTDKTSISDWRIAKGRLITTFFFFFPGKSIAWCQSNFPKEKQETCLLSQGKRQNGKKELCRLINKHRSLKRPSELCCPWIWRNPLRSFFLWPVFCKVSLPFSSVVESLILLLTVLMEDSAPLSDLTLSCKLCFPSARK